jgi:hypothetical protein
MPGVKSKTDNCKETLEKLSILATLKIKRWLNELTLSIMLQQTKINRLISHRAPQKISTIRPDLC